MWHSILLTASDLHCSKTPLGVTKLCPEFSWDLENNLDTLSRSASYVVKGLFSNGSWIVHVTLLLFSESRKYCEHRMTLQNLVDSACYFLFDFNRKRAPILYRFRDIASYLSKVADYNLPHLHLAPPLEFALIEFSRDFWRQKTRFPGLSSGAVCLILSYSRTPTCDRHRAIVYSALA